MAKLKVLFATSEIAPLIKTGGLADVSGALPAALRAIGVEVRVLVPGYTQVIEQLVRPQVMAQFDNLPGFPVSRLLSSTMANGVSLLILDCPELYQRDGGPYQDAGGHDWADNAVRFGLLSKVAAVLSSYESPLIWHPDLLHCNDWQTGLAPAYLKFSSGAAPSVMTIHNMAFQGVFPLSVASELGLPSSSLSIKGVEYYGSMSFLKAGLYYADHLTTVSPTYAQEIQTEAFGFGMQGLLLQRRDALTGILNGIDTDEWDPATDPYMVKKYDAAHLGLKVFNKAALQSNLSLNLEPDIPLLGVVSRFAEQKGLDLLMEVTPQLLELPVQLAILGNGDKKIQRTVRDLWRQYPGKIGAVIGFSEALSHQIEAGADMFIMPSRFEPCGLNQMYSQRYGTPPVVHATGGLADSVVDCNMVTLADGTASGFVFNGMRAENLFDAIKRAVDLYHHKRKWRSLCKNCMGKDFSWELSAKAYHDVYLKVTGQD